jgi:3-oxoacyl-[acyl-carrier protein] reductase
MDLHLKNKTAIVCGSTQGIGLATAKTLATEGARVICLARNEEKLKNIIATLPKPFNQNHQYFVVDFSGILSNEHIIKQLESLEEVHVLVNNTGGPKGGNLHEANYAELNEAFATHVIAAQILTQTVLSKMKTQGFGRIINVTSVGQKQPVQGLGVSNVIRGAMASWAKTMANELGQFGVTVNNVLPGYTSTNRLKEVNQNRAKSLNISLEEVENKLLSETPIGRFVDASETAAMIAFLCSAQSGAITGVNIQVDGGRISSM